jgi:hypothetical protein
MNVIEECPERRDQPGDMREDGASDHRGPHAPAGSLEERDAQIALKLPDAGRDRGLRTPKYARRRADAAALHDCVKRVEEIQIDVRELRRSTHVRES